MATLFQSAYEGWRVFVTGHTGFKGSWVSLWLESLGATVAGYALEPSTEPSHFELLKLGMRSTIADLKDGAALRKSLEEAQPGIVLHLAAQPIARSSSSRRTIVALPLQGAVELHSEARRDL